MDPVAYKFARLTTLEAFMSKERYWEALPTREAMLIDTRNVTPSPEPALHRNVVSDSHPVISHPVRDIDPDPENTARPMPAPVNVKLAEPLVAKFTLLDVLTRTESVE
jgi:hypothetical protein